MRIAFITAGAAGMYCGSCLRDNALVRALQNLGQDAILIPTYTPTKTDDINVSDPHVFYGGINVYLQEKSSIFRHTPRFIDRLFDWPVLLKWASRYAQRTAYDKLGGLTISMLQGRNGHQQKELTRLVDWLKNDIQPDVILLTNVLLSGMAPELKRVLDVPVLATLQGDDIFLDALLPDDRKQCLELIRSNSKSLAGFISTSHYYADHMSGYLGLDRGRIEVIPPGISLDGLSDVRLPRSDTRPAIGFFARISPEKGLHHLIDAFIELRKSTKAPVLRVSGWLGEQHGAYFLEQKAKLAEAGLLSDFEHMDSPDLRSKSRFLRSLEVLSVPTTYQEPKGLYVLEAWASGVPVVLPKHGCFPELVAGCDGGSLVMPGDVRALAAELGRYVSDREYACQRGANGRQAVRERYTSEVMAQATLAYLERFVRVPSGVS